MCVWQPDNANPPQMCRFRIVLYNISAPLLWPEIPLVVSFFFSFTTLIFNNTSVEAASLQVPEL